MYFLLNSTNRFINFGKFDALIGTTLRTTNNINVWKIESLKNSVQEINAQKADLLFVKKNIFLFFSWP